MPPSAPALRAATLERVDSAPHVAGSIDEAIGRLQRGEPFCAAPHPPELLGPATAMVKDLPLNLWQGALSAGHHMFKPWGKMANGDHDGTKGLWDWQSGDPAAKLDRLRRAAKANPVAGLGSGMVNVYGSDLHSAFSVPIAEAFERAARRHADADADAGSWKIGHNRMYCRLKAEQLSLDGCKYHYEGQLTGLGLEELAGKPFIGVICPVPTQPRGFCGIRYRPGHDHASFTAAVAADRAGRANVVDKANNFFLGLGPAFWTATDAGRTIEPVELIFPANHVILFNGCLPHGISKATAGLGLYIDLSPGEDAAAAPHDAFHVRQAGGTDLMRRKAGEPYPTKGYFDAETYALPWRLHKLWAWCMLAPPSHWPSGKQSFLVHTMASAATAKNSLRQRHVVKSGPKRTSQFRYDCPADRTVTLDPACKARCERQGFTIPAELLGKRVMRDPSALPRGYAVRFGWPAVATPGPATTATPPTSAAVPPAVAAEAAAAQQASRAAARTRRAAGEDKKGD